MTATERKVSHVLKILSNEAVRNELMQEISAMATECLKGVAERQRIGAGDTIWTLLNDHLIPLPAALKENESDNGFMLGQDLFILLRNCVAGVPQNQQQAYDLGYVEAAEEFVKGCSAMGATQSKSTISALQFLSNTLTGNSAVCKLCWNRWTSNEHSLTWLSSCLKASTDHKILMVVLILILNSIRGDCDTCSEIVNTASSRDILGILLANVWGMHDDSSSQNFDLLFEVVRQIIDHGLWTSLYGGLSVAKAPQSAITKPQYALIMLLDAKMHKSPDSVIPVHDLITAYVDLTAYTRNALIGVNADAPLRVVEEMHPEVLDTYNAVATVLQSLIDLALGTVYRRQLIADVRVLDQAIALLAAAEKILPRSTLKTMPSKIRQIEATNDYPSYFVNLKKLLVQLIGTLAFEEPSIQDRTRELGGLGLVLSQCNIDDDNPFIREHSLFAMRNLLKSNTRNQDLIGGMTPIEAKLDEGIAQDTGLQASLDEAGRPRLKKSGF